MRCKQSRLVKPLFPAWLIARDGILTLDRRKLLIFGDSIEIKIEDITGIKLESGSLFASINIVSKNGKEIKINRVGKKSAQRMCSYLDKKLRGVNQIYISGFTQKN